MPANGVPPTDPEHVRSTVANAYAEALGRTQVDHDASFFDLGGDSILLATVRNRLHEELPGLEFGLLDLFQHPSVGALTDHLTRVA